MAPAPAHCELIDRNALLRSIVRAVMRKKEKTVAWAARRKEKNEDDASILEMRKGVTRRREICRVIALGRVKEAGGIGDLN